jgi:GT2 family glycosyltransferase
MKPQEKQRRPPKNPQSGPERGDKPAGAGLSIILVTYNHRDFILPCLRSLSLISGDLDPEIILVDNHSSDGTGQLVRENFRQARLIENPKNLGFARAVNQGFRESRGDVVLLLNPDIQVLPGAIESMTSYLRNDRRTGILLPKLINPDGSLQYSCRTFCHPFIFFLRRAPLSWVFSNHRAVRRHLMMDWDHQDIRQVDWGLGACMMVRREALGETEMLDERFFLYFEDIDLCFSLNKSGWKTVYYPEAVLVHHYLRESAGALFNRAKWEHLKSLIKFYFKLGSLKPKTFRGALRAQKQDSN